MNNNNFRDYLPRLLPWAPAFFLALALIVLPAAFCQKKLDEPVKPEKKRTSIFSSRKKSSSDKPAKKGKRRYSGRKKNRKNKSESAPQSVASVAPDAESSSSD